MNSFACALIILVCTSQTIHYRTCLALRYSDKKECKPITYSNANFIVIMKYAFKLFVDK